jgi:hypothetical protein
MAVRITSGYNPDPLEMLRCDEHKDELAEKAKGGSFEIVELKRVTHE